MSLQITFSRVYQFTCAHRLNSRDLSEMENTKVYDKCNNINGHGHDYKLEVTVAGEIDAKTGMIIPLEVFDQNVHNVLVQIDYKHLDKEVDYFKQHISSGEIIIQYLWQELSKQFPGEMLYHLKLWETNNNYFEFGNA